MFLLVHQDFWFCRLIHNLKISVKQIHIEQETVEYTSSEEINIGMSFYKYVRVEPRIEVKSKMTVCAHVGCERVLKNIVKRISPGVFL